MHAISLWQPWASLLMGAKKRIETRSWQPWLTMPQRLAIHAAKQWTPELVDLCKREPFQHALRNLGYADASLLPRGCILGVVELFGCETTEELLPNLTPHERMFGDYSPGRYGWLTKHPLPLVVPIPFKGKQGIFTVPNELLTELMP